VTSAFLITSLLLLEFEVIEFLCAQVKSGKEAGCCSMNVVSYRALFYLTYRVCSLLYRDKIVMRCPSSLLRCDARLWTAFWQQYDFFHGVFISVSSYAALVICATVSWDRFDGSLVLRNCKERGCPALVLCTELSSELFERLRGGWFREDVDGSLSMM
jgi:hypothetical protein